MTRQQDYFIQSLTLLLKSGMPIIDAVSSLAEEADRKNMQKKLLLLKDELESGSNISSALEKADLLPKRFQALLRIGEETGQLSEQLVLIKQQINKEKVLKAHLTEAFIYPATVLSVTLIVSVLTMVYTFPKLISVFSAFGGKLPLSTRIIISLGHFFQYYGLIVIVLFVIIFSALIFLLFIYRGTKKIGEAIIFGISPLAALVQEIELARFGYMLGTLIKAGISIPQALDSLEEGTSFIYYQEFYAGIRTDIIAGNSLYESVTHQPHSDRYVPAHITSLLSSGERSGLLADTLLTISNSYEETIDAVSRNLNALLEPIIILIVGLIVALIAFSIITPIYGLVSQIN